MITAGWADGHAVDHSFASAWDDGVMLASRRSWWRIAAEIEDQSARPVAPTRRSNSDRTPREAPVLEATGPGQVWSWDITDLRTPWRGVAFKDASKVSPYWTLLPYRTFREVDQPASLFLLRLSKSGGDKPRFALYEADGGSWQIEAVERIKSYLEDALPQGVAIIG